MDFAPDRTAPFFTDVKNVEAPTVKNNVPNSTSELVSHQQHQLHKIQTLNDLTRQNQCTRHNSQITTPVKPTALKKWLLNYDPQVSAFLIDDFTFGFKIPYFGKRTFTNSKNLKSADQHVPVLQQMIDKEVMALSLYLPSKNLLVSPLGLGWGNY